MHVTRDRRRTLKTREGEGQSLSVSRKTGSRVDLESKHPGACIGEEVLCLDSADRLWTSGSHIEVAACFVVVYSVWLKLLLLSQRATPCFHCEGGLDSVEGIGVHVVV